MMAQVLRSPSHFPSSASTTATSPTTTAASSPSSSSSSCAPRPSLSCAAPTAGCDALLSAPDSPPSIAAATDGYDDEEDSDGCDGRGGSGGELAKGRERRDCAGGNDGGGGGGGEQLSLLALLLTIFRKSLIACKSDRREICTMEIGWPTNVRHVAHVTFDRFHGFLGLPVEFEPEVPSRAPSASTRVFGVSTESMQLSYDSRGNSVPTILLLLQQRLYAQGGLQAEGIFRINAENGQEEHVRDQLNRGVLPEGIDTHCLAGLIKAWFRELPTGVLDSLSPERVMQSQTEDECAELVRFLPPTEAALLNWAINLMADVVQMEHLNKMNARNIAMVFAPNMTQMADPLTALMYAVQVMNFLKTLIMRTLREREDPKIEPAPVFDLEPFDESGHQSPQPCQADDADGSEGTEQVFTSEDPDIDNSSNFDEKTSTSQAELCGWMETTEVNIMKGETETGSFYGIDVEGRGHEEKSNFGRSNAADFEEAPRKMELHQPAIQVMVPVEKSRVIDIGGLSCINSRTEWIEAWR